MYYSFWEDPLEKGIATHPRIAACIISWTGEPGRLHWFVNSQTRLSDQHFQFHYNFCIHSSVNGHLGCFYVLAIVKSAAMNIRVHVSISIMVYSGYTPSSGIAGSYGSSIPPFLKNPHTL